MNEDLELVGTLIDERYQVESELGAGAMGAVYKARHVAFTRHVAIKVIHRELLSSESMVERFEREATAAGKLEHRNVVPVLDAGVLPDGRRYMVLEFVTGKTLGELITGPLESRLALSIAKQLCDGLDHAHAQGLIHRDLKPDNIVVDPDGTARIIDFGIATLFDPKNSQVHVGKKLTNEGIVMGTPSYMAPEQATGVKLDRRADIFALGVIIYEMLCGKTPFDGQPLDVAIATVTRDAPAFAERVPGLSIDPEIEAVVRKFLVRDRDHRLPTARECRIALEPLTKRQRTQPLTSFMDF